MMIQVDTNYKPQLTMLIKKVRTTKDTYNFKQKITL